MEENIKNIRDQVSSGDTGQEILEQNTGIKRLDGECEILYSNGPLSLLLSAEQMRLIVL